MSAVSADSAGVLNYTVKRDFRRVLDREIRAEGNDYFRPNTSIPLGDQPFPNSPNTTEPITLEVMARQPNGRTAVIAGTPTTLFRFFALDNGAYFQGDGTPAEYFEDVGPDTPYYDDNPGVWLVIGTGFSPFAQRWECELINGYLVLNNGVDLPVTYRVEENSVRPIYEMRELGIASVGNITTINSLLVCGDVSQIQSDKLVEILSNISAGTATASQAGSFGPSTFDATMIAGAIASAQPIFDAGSVGKTIQFINGISAVITGFVDASNVTTASADTVNPGLPFFLINPGTTDYTVVSSVVFFDATMVGRQIIWDNGAVRTITAFVDPLTVVVDTNGPVLAGTFALNNPAAYAPFTDQSFIDRIQYRIVWSMPDQPRRWGAVVPGSITAGSNVLELDYPALSFSELIGQQIVILGAGLNGGNLTGTLLFIAPNGTTLLLDAVAVTTVTEADVSAFDSIGSIVGFFDLQDDGSGIVGMMELSGYLIVYKDTAIFVGQYNGVAGSVFTFDGQNKYKGSKTLYYRYTLIKVNAGGQDFHLFAGRQSFYRFDIVTRQPVEVETGELCKNLFFDNVDLPGFTLGPELVTPQDYPANKQIRVPVVAGQVYYYTPGEDELQMFNGAQLLTTPGQFVAQINVLVFIGTHPNRNITASIRQINNIGVFAADNPITKEVFFCFPTAKGKDKALRYDYFTGQVSTTSAAYSAAAAIKRPVAGIQIGPSEDWFIMGTLDGTILRYGLTNTKPLASGDITATQAGNTVTASAGIFAPDLVLGKSIQFDDLTLLNVVDYIDAATITVGGPPQTRAASGFQIVSAIWHRVGLPYDSVLQSGAEGFGKPMSEKAIEAWVLTLSSESPNSSVLFELLGGISPSKLKVLGSKLFVNPQVKNAAGMMFLQNYLQDRITVSGMNNPLEIVQRLYNISGVDSKAFSER